MAEEISDERRTIWQRLIGNGRLARPPLAVRIGMAVVVMVVLMVVVTALYANVPPEGQPGPAIEYPEEWDVGWEVIKWIDGIVEWVVITWEPFFVIIRTMVLGILIPFRNFLMWLPWWLVIAGTGILTWRVVGVRFGVIALLFLSFIAVMGLINLLMMTLAITLTATLLCVVLGIPVGIATAQSNRFEVMLRPILDGMQTMPSFVYLIPALMLFGLGMTPAVMATMIYAIPPIVRLTNLGIRQLDTSVLEAAKSFGATPWQLLTKVQIPLAMPTIMAGLNQTIMMALAMVIIASMIGAKGLGAEVLSGIARLEVGRGFVAGISIVFVAIILDRISQSLARRPEVKPTT